MWNVTLRQLKVFEAVGRHLSFSRAAEELHLTQPAVSMQVRQLEETVGSPLTEQIGKKIFLTAAGCELARHARLIAQQLRDAEAALDALAGLRTGRLNVGFVSTTKYFAAHLLAVFRRRYPGLELRLSVFNREQIVQQLADNQIDLAVMGRPPHDVATEAETFAEHPLTMIAAAEHPLCRKALVEPADLAGETFLIREQGSGTRAAMESYFSEVGIEPHAWLEMTGNETIKQSVMANMGIAFLSEHAVGLEMSVGRLCRLRMHGLPVMRRWHVVHLKEKRLSPVACAFRDFLLSEGAALIASAVGEAAGAGEAGPVLASAPA